MDSKTPIFWISIAVYWICLFDACYCLDYNGAQVVTYGEPCVTARRLPFQIEGPRPPPIEEKIPVSLSFKTFVSDMYVQPRRVEYPVTVEMPCTTPSPSEKLIIDDTLRGKVYGYNTYVPPSANLQYAPRNYNFAMEVPAVTKDINGGSTYECETRQLPRLKGLKSRIDRVLVPACEVYSPPSSPCQCN